MRHFRLQHHVIAWFKDIPDVEATAVTRSCPFPAHRGTEVFLIRNVLDQTGLRSSYSLPFLLDFGVKRAVSREPTCCC